MALEIWPQLAGYCDECECQFFKLSVTSFCVKKRFAHIVDWELLAFFFSYEHSADYVLGDCEVNIEFSPSFGLERSGGEVRYLLRSCRACSQAGVHSKSLDLRRVLKNR